MDPPEGLTRRFLEELVRTLDIDEAARNLNITKEEARAILEGLLGKRAAQEKKGGHSEYLIYVDGASRGNPGKAGAGIVIKDPEGEVVKKLKRYLGITTNNMAEYQALITALEEAGRLRLKNIKVLADSELMVKQINGLYKVKSEDLRPLFKRAMDLIEGFEDFNITHITREKNSEADSLANAAIDAR